MDLGERGGRGMEVGERENAAVMHCNTEEQKNKLPLKKE